MAELQVPGCETVLLSLPDGSLLLLHLPFLATDITFYVAGNRNKLKISQGQGGKNRRP